MLGQVKDHGRFDSKDAHVKFKTGHVYDGDFNRGMMHGQGKLSWPNGTTYTGEFQDNTITGQGDYQWPDGSSYQGQVRDRTDLIIILFNVCVPQRLPFNPTLNAATLSSV